MCSTKDEEPVVASVPVAGKVGQASSLSLFPFPRHLHGSERRQRRNPPDCNGAINPPTTRSEVRGVAGRGSGLTAREHGLMVLTWPRPPKHRRISRRRCGRLYAFKTVLWPNRCLPGRDAVISKAKGLPPCNGSNRIFVGKVRSHDAELDKTLDSLN